MFIDDVRRIIERAVREVTCSIGAERIAPQTMPGKMLRSRLVQRLVESGAVEAGEIETVSVVCAATELAHTATLCHDDVIDEAGQRRSKPTLWRMTSPSGAILIGDILVCEAAELMLNLKSKRHIAEFLARIREVCAAEAEQELILRHTAPDEQTCLRIARGKTGPLFAMPSAACAGSALDLRAALDEAGYRIGAAYQLADDLLDVHGDEALIGKTLGTDRLRQKFTLPQSGESGERAAAEHIDELLGSAVELLAPWPTAHAGLDRFVSVDLRPLLARHVQLSSMV